jgi:hypothetical protein
MSDDTPDNPQAAAVERLAALGLSAETIAYTLDQPIGNVRATLTIKKRVIDDADQELRDDARSLAQLAIRKARRFLEFGPPDVQVAIIRSLLTGSTKLINTGQEAGTIETRLALDELLNESRRVPERETIVTDSGIIDVPIDNAASANIQHQPPDHAIAVLHASQPPAVTKTADDQNGETWLPET